MKIKIFDSMAKIPEKAHQTDAGFDLFACGDYNAATRDDFVIPPYETFNHDNASRLVRTGIGIELPECTIPGHQYQAIVKGRSSLAKKGLIVIDGIIDNGYRGEILVKVINLTHEAIAIRKDMKIAQLIIYITPIINSLQIVDDLTASERGEKGFGSSGI
jgi:dUTP pyrophosphatase